MTSCHHESKITVGSVPLKTNICIKKHTVITNVTQQMFYFILTCTVCSCESSITDTVTTEHSPLLLHSAPLIQWVATCTLTSTIYTEWIELLFLSSWNNNINEVFTYLLLQITVLALLTARTTWTIYRSIHRASHDMHAGWFLMACFIRTLASSVKAQPGRQI